MVLVRDFPLYLCGTVPPAEDSETCYGDFALVSLRPSVVFKNCSLSLQFSHGPSEPDSKRNFVRGTIEDRRTSNVESSHSGIPSYYSVSFHP